MTAKLFASLGYFSGLNTVAESSRLATMAVQIPEGYKSAYPLTEAMNVEIDNSFALKSRSGLTSLFTGTGMHSFWANREGTLCFYAAGTILYRLMEDYSSIAMTTLSSRNRMSFTEFNSRIYYTNGEDIGYIENETRYGLSKSSLDYKMPLPAGQFICVHQGRLFIAKGNVLYISDPLSHYYDVRTGYRVFDSDIRMLLSVEKGLYVSDNKTWFLSPGKVLESDTIELKRTFADMDYVIPYTAVVVDGALISENGIEGLAGIWVSKTGVCIGDQNGKVENVSQKNYVLSEFTEGSAVVREVDNVIHYIAVMRK